MTDKPFGPTSQRTITVYVELGLVGCRRESTIEVDDDAMDDEIEEMARDEMFNMIEWGWR